MKKFIGRKSELNALNKAYQSSQSEFIVVYGRRRVGKSELILEFIKGKAAVYYLGKKANTQLQINEFLIESAEGLKEPLLSGYSTDNWKEALSIVVERCDKGQKLIIALDEFQWTVEKSPELISFIQELWDRKWKNTGKLMLILCGSLIGFFEQNVLGNKSPLFGRRTAQILLNPFGYHEAADFHPNYSYEEKAKTYFICGGIPLYLNVFNKNVSVETNIIENTLDPFLPLYREPDFLLKEELRDVTNYYAILHAIATGKNHHKEIAGHVGIDNRGLNYYLKQLLELGYVMKRYPLFHKRQSAKNVIYNLGDPFLRFWFRFIYPNTSYLAHVGGKKVFTDRIKPLLNAYFGYCFEGLCREALPFIYKKKGVNAPFEIGEFWNNDVQVDVVGIREDRWVDLGECKWGEIRSKKALIREIESKQAKYPNPQNYTIACHIFTKAHSPKADSDTLSWHTLKELYQ